MSEWASTSLGFTPVPLPWYESLARVHSYLIDNHDLEGPMPTHGRLWVVDTAQHAIVRGRDLPLRDPTGPEPPGIALWRTVRLEIYVGGAMHSVPFSFRSITESLTEVEAWFPTLVHEAVYDFDPARHGFREEIKADLLRLFVGMARALGAEGFGYRMAEEDSVYVALSTNDLRDYIEVGLRWSGHPLALRMAGLRADLVPEERFEYDVDEEHPVHYRHQGFYVFDLLWPR